MYMGLDLRGGVYFLLEVDMAPRAPGRRALHHDLRQLLRNEKLRYKGATRAEAGDPRHVWRPGDREKAYDLVRRNFSDLLASQTESGGDYVLALRLNEAAVKELKKFALQQNLTTLRNRVNELGWRSP